MPVQSYNVPLVSPELRQEEFVVQVAESLDYLEKITEDVFNRITQRVQENQQKLDAINKRTDIAQAKINAMKGSKKAIRVFSSAKYPATDELDFYKSIFDIDSELNDIKREQKAIASKHKPVDVSVMKEKLQFYNVNVKTKKDDENNKKGEGLGKLPKKLESISSLLLFNTAENPYNKYVIMDPLAGNSMKVKLFVKVAVLEVLESSYEYLCGSVHFKQECPLARRYS